MVQKHNKPVSISYSIFEDEKGTRYLSPEIELLKILFPKNKFQLTTSVKTAKTVTYLLGHKQAGNKIDLINIEGYKGSIKALLVTFNQSIIKTENQVKHLLNTFKPEDKETNNSIQGKISLLEKLPLEKKDKFLENIEDKLVLEPMPFYTKIEDNTKKENLYLVNHLNYYLNELGLKQIKNINQYTIFDLSTIGDKMLGIDIILRHGVTGTKTDMNIINSNKIQQFAMSYLGFLEFLYSSEHLAGTFFETIYAVAKLQNNEEIVDKMLRILVNHLPETKPYELPEFKD